MTEEKSKAQWFRWVTDALFWVDAHQVAPGGVGCPPPSINPDERVKLRGPPPGAHTNDGRARISTYCAKRGQPLGVGWDDAPCHAVMTQGVMMV